MDEDSIFDCMACLPEGKNSGSKGLFNLIYFPNARNQRQQVHITMKVLTLKNEDD